MLKLQVCTTKSTLRTYFKMSVTLVLSGTRTCPFILWPEGTKYEKFNKKTIPLFIFLGAKLKNQALVRAFEILAYFISDTQNTNASKWF